LQPQQHRKRILPLSEEAVFIPSRTLLAFHGGEVHERSQVIPCADAGDRFHDFGSIERQTALDANGDFVTIA
jgi:hypothetical protein